MTRWLAGDPFGEGGVGITAFRELPTTRARRPYAVTDYVNQ
jgi:hypothetical protein